MTERMTDERRAEIREHVAWTRDRYNCVDDFHHAGARGCVDLLAEVERLRAELADTVGEARSDIAGLESLARRLRTAWESARNGRRSARRLNAELVRSMDMLRAELADEKRRNHYVRAGNAERESARLRAELAETTHALTVTGEKVEALRGQRDRAETERDEAREHVKRVRAEHPQETDAQDRPVCGACRDAYEEPMPWPCPTMRALGGTEPGQ